MRNNPQIVQYRVRDPFREFDSLVKWAFGPQTAPGQRNLGFVPAAETHRDGDDAVVRLELPGVDAANDVNVEILDGQLVISGERRDERVEEDGGRHTREFSYGAFKRAFTVGSRITADQVTASYDAGVLTVRVAGAYAKPEGQKIAIETTPTAAVEGSSEVIEGETTSES